MGERREMRTVDAIRAEAQEYLAVDHDTRTWAHDLALSVLGLCDRLDEALAAPRTHPWFASPPNHMKGWEAFGVSPGERTVRRLGTVTFVKGEATTDERPGTEPWGSGEVRLGVAGITISTSADAPEQAFIQVIGTTEEDVATRWDEASARWMRLRSSLWPKSRASASGRSGG